jgi:hypothetical protein
MHWSGVEVDGRMWVSSAARAVTGLNVEPAG